MRVSRVVASALIILAAAPQAARAQCSCPAAGRWGAEATLSSGIAASLLKFRTADAAWMLGLTGNLARVHEESSASGLPSNSADATQAALGLSVGYRWYGPAAGSLRPFTGLLVTGTYASTTGDNFAGSHSWGIGPSLEMGGSYFFSPHLSLGASGALAATYTHTSVDVPGSQTETAYGINLRLVRVLAAVYF
ncbi:MAG TPA: hypothetical protein VJU87_05150 [Gemmatimonadaceae bacterium]|nr:hypothetical protein [Gemmatimonadaceae bacterium]